MTECLGSMQESTGFHSNNTCHMSVIAALRRWKQKNQKFMLWATRKPKKRQTDLRVGVLFSDESAHPEYGRPWISKENVNTKL